MKRVLYKLVFAFTLLYLILDGITGGYYHEYALLQSYTGTFTQHVEQDNSVLEDAAETQDNHVGENSRLNTRSSKRNTFLYSSFPDLKDIDSAYIAACGIRTPKLPAYYTFLFRLCPF